MGRGTETLSPRPAWAPEPPLLIMPHRRVFRETPEERFWRLGIESRSSTPKHVKIKGNIFRRERSVPAVGVGEVSGRVQVKIGRVTESLSVQGSKLGGIASVFVWNIDEGAVIKMDSNALVLAQNPARGTLIEVTGEKAYFNDPDLKNPLPPGRYIVDFGRIMPVEDSNRLRMGKVLPMRRTYKDGTTARVYMTPIAHEIFYDPAYTPPKPKVRSDADYVPPPAVDPFEGEVLTTDTRPGNGTERTRLASKAVAI